MKKLFFVLGFSIAVLAVKAQDIPQTQVPAPVLNTFQQQYKNTTNVKWEKKKESYEVKFEAGKTKHKLKIDASGKVIKHDEDIKHTDLPAAIQKQISAQFAGYKIKDPEKIEEGGKITYKVELKKDNDTKKVHFNTDGTVISNKKD